MALNKLIYFANPTKARTLGLSDTIRADVYAYATIYTVLVTETLSIKDVVVNLFGENTSGAIADGRVILDISGKEIVLYSNNNIGVAALVNENITMSTDIGISNIVLSTGDTIKLKYIYDSAGAGTYSATMKGTIILEDFTA